MGDLKILDAKKEGIELLNRLETFIQIEWAPHYYISVSDFMSCHQIAHIS